MPLTNAQQAKIDEKEAMMADSLKRTADVNYYEGWFFVTLNTRDQVPVLSTCEGSPSIPDGQPGAPHCLYTDVGRGVVEAWRRNQEVYDHVEADLCEAMPEHFHGLIHLLPGNRRHLGQIIKGFMIGCSHNYWDTLGINWRAMSYVKGVRTPQYEDRDHTHSKRGPALFVHGYNDTEAITPEQVETKRAYIRDQARKRLIQGDRHLCFKKHRHQHSRNWTVGRVLQAIAVDRVFRNSPYRCQEAQQKVLARLNQDEPQAPTAPASTQSSGNPVPMPRIGLDFIGDEALLYIKKKLPLVCHSADAWQFDRQKDAVLKAAREGAMIVSAFISQKERDIKTQLMVEQLPFIEIMDNGLSDKYKGIGKAFYALAENRLLQITPWTYLYQKDGVLVSREMCMVMNELARVISGQPDDWWK